MGWDFIQRTRLEGLGVKHFNIASRLKRLWTKQTNSSNEKLIKFQGCAKTYQIIKQHRTNNNSDNNLFLYTMTWYCMVLYFDHIKQPWSQLCMLTAPCNLSEPLKDLSSPLRCRRHRGRGKYVYIHVLYGVIVALHKCTVVGPLSASANPSWDKCKQWTCANVLKHLKISSLTFSRFLSRFLTQRTATIKEINLFSKFDDRPCFESRMKEYTRKQIHQDEKTSPSKSSFQSPQRVILDDVIHIDPL